MEYDIEMMQSNTIVKFHLFYLFYELQEFLLMEKFRGRKKEKRKLTQERNKKS